MSIDNIDEVMGWMRGFYEEEVSGFEEWNFVEPGFWENDLYSVMVVSYPMKGILKVKVLTLESKPFEVCSFIVPEDKEDFYKVMRILEIC